MAEPLAWCNGQFVPERECCVPVTDPCLFGVGAFDNCRTWNRRLFRFDDHLARLRRDCEACRLPLPDADFPAIAREILRTNCGIANDDLHLVTLVTPGSVALFTRPVDHDRNRRLRTQGVALRIVGVTPFLPGGMVSPRVKHRNRLHWHLAEQRVAPGELAVLLDRPDGTLTETAIACLLAVIDGMLVTPPREMILDSISLRVTLELAKRLGLPVAEREIHRRDLVGVSEMLLTGSGFGLAGVTRVDDAVIPWPGPVLARLLSEWDRVVASESDDF